MTVPVAANAISHRAPLHQHSLQPTCQQDVLVLFLSGSLCFTGSRNSPSAPNSNSAVTRSSDIRHLYCNLLCAVRLTGPLLTLHKLTAAGADKNLGLEAVHKMEPEHVNCCN